MHCAGEGTSDRFEKFKFSDSGQDTRDNIEAFLERFRNLYKPRKNVFYDTHLFFQRKQLPGESFECFLNALKTDAKKCKFGELKDRFICKQIIFGHQDKLVQDKLLLDPNIKLNKAIDIFFDVEARRLRKQIDSSGAVNAVVSMNLKLIPKLKKSTNSADLVINNCKYWGKQHKVQQCPAFGKMCRNCGKRNHFENVCLTSPSKVMHQIEAEG